MTSINYTKFKSKYCTTMEDKILDANLFAVNEKVNRAYQLMGLNYSNPTKYEFYRGQYMAFNEVYTMLNNSK